MNKSLLLLAPLSFCVGACGAEASQQTPPPVQQSDSFSAIVAIFSDKDVLVAATRRDVPANLRASPELKALELEYPGIMNYVIAQTLPKEESRVIDRAPRMWNQIAALIRPGLPEPDAVKVLAFYRGSTGLKIVSIIRRIAMKTPVRQYGEPGKMNEADVQKSGQAAIAASGGIGSQLTPAELADTARFLASPAGQKWQSLQPRLNAAIATIRNQEMQIGMSAFIADIQSAVADFERDNPKRASS